MEQMEFRLKEDILQEASRYVSCQYCFLPVFTLKRFVCLFYLNIWWSRYGNKILVTDELPNGQMVDQWESVVTDTVKTPLEVRIDSRFGYIVLLFLVPLRICFLCIGIWGVAASRIPCRLWACSYYWWKGPKRRRFWQSG